MARQSTLDRLADIGRKRHGLAVAADWRYPQFFNFLQVSPSYRLAHAIATKAIDSTAIALPADFHLVQNTYAAFGDVHQTFFYDWWVKRAQFQFGVNLKPETQIILNASFGETTTDEDIANARDRLVDYLMIDRPAQGQSATMVVAIPFTGSKKADLKSFAAIWDDIYGDKQQAKKVAPFQLIRNKMREQTFKHALRILRARAAMPDAKLYVIGNRTKIAPALWTDETKPVGDHYWTRRTMEMIVSRHLNRAYAIAENAARGKFPSLDPLPDDPARPVFDVLVLRKQFVRYIRWLESERTRLKSIQHRIAST